MEMSADIKDLACALAKAQAELTHASKSSTNAGFRAANGKPAKYADLAAVWEACREVLTKYGLSVSQFIESDEPNRVKLTTQLMHQSGQWLRSTASLPVTKQDPHGHGSGITYLRRYALAAAVGVYQDDDDDANEAAGKSAPAGRSAAAGVPTEVVNPKDPESVARFNRMQQVKQSLTPAAAATKKP